MSDAEHFTRKVLAYTTEDNFLTGGRKHFAQLDCRHEVRITADEAGKLSALICPDCRDAGHEGMAEGGP